MNEEIKKSRTLWQDALIRFKRNKLAVAGFIFLMFLLIMAVGTFVIDIVTRNYIYNTYVINQNLTARLHLPMQDPGISNILGNDEFGRSLLFRLVWGARYSLFIGISSVLTSLVVGGFLGAIAGFFGGKLDNIIMRIMDILLAIPYMLMAIAIVSALGTSLLNLLISLAIPSIPGFSRIVRASVMSVKDMDFVEASKAVGASDGRIIFKYILPNAITPVIVQATLGVAHAIIGIAAMSYLGLGVQPPLPEWGSILSNAKTYMRVAWHITVIPGLAIMLTILSLNVFGDGLRDALDPKLKN